MTNDISPRKSARLWHYVSGEGEGWVRILLTRERPRVEHVWFVRDEEGWSREASVWIADFDREVVRLETYSDGVDCDGRMSRDWIGECSFTDLDAGRGWQDHPVPRWEEVDASQRDYSAEAAGY